jgi:hypothetical protein
MANHVFTEKENTQYGGDSNNNNNNNMNNKILAGAIPLSKLYSNTAIKAISHLGIPCGLISCNKQSHKAIIGGGYGQGNNIQSIQKSHDDGVNQYNESLTNQLFSLINK